MRILVSACLLGEKVRYDGGHKRDPFLVETFGRYVEYVPVCPETECGLPTPREPMRLAGDPASPRLVTERSRIDHTRRLLDWAEGRLAEIESLDVWGYVCKKGSPSSGMEGVFTKAFLERFPLIPVEDEERLHDPELRDLFIERIFTLRRFRYLAAAGKTRAVLAGFHADHKLLLMSHDRRLYSRMGKLVAWAKEMTVGNLYARYQELLLEALGRRATVARRADALMHAAGRFRKALSPEEREEILESVAQYKAGIVPFVVPATLMRHHVRRRDVAYLRRQVFLHPHPLEQLLRNHA